MPRRGLAALFSGPREVTLAGRAYLVDEFTLGDLAELEAARLARRPDPLGPVRGLLWADAVAPADRYRFNEAFDLAESDSDGTETTDAAVAADWLALLGVALRRHHPEVAADPAALLAILGSLGAGELAAVREAAHRPDPMAVLCRALDRFCGTGGPDDDGPDDTDWPALVDRVARSHGLSYAEIRAMTRTQFLNALAEGRAVDGRPARSVAEAEASHAKWTRWLAGDDGDGTEGVG